MTQQWGMFYLLFSQSEKVYYNLYSTRTRCRLIPDSARRWSVHASSCSRPRRGHVHYCGPSTGSMLTNLNSGFGHRRGMRSSSNRRYVWCSTLQDRKGAEWPDLTVTLCLSALLPKPHGLCVRGRVHSGMQVVSTNLPFLPRLQSRQFSRANRIRKIFHQVLRLLVFFGGGCK